MKAVYKRELKAYLHNVYGFLFAAVLLLTVGYFVFAINLNPSYYYADISYALQPAELALILLVPILCMRTMSEDKRNKTDMFYLSLPMRTSSVVFGKYLALLTVFAIPTLVICLYPLILNLFGSVNLLSAYVSIFFFFLLGAALMAVCMFVSSLTGHMVISAVLGILVMGVLYFAPWLAALLPQTALVSYIGLLAIFVLLSVAVYAFAKSLKVTAIWASVTIVPLTTAYAVGEILVTRGVIQSSFMKQIFHLLLCYISPFFVFENLLSSQIFDIFAIILMLSIATFFILLTIQSADRRRWA